MQTGITFGEWDTSEALALGVDMIRTDVPPAPDDLRAFVRPLVTSPLDYVFILHDVARNEVLLDAMRDEGFNTAHALIEPFNEREKGAVTPWIMVDAITALYRDCTARGFEGRIVASGDSALKRDAMRFYQAVAPRLPSDCIVAFHDYPWKTQPLHRPWPPYTSHEMALATFLDAIEGRPAACSEFGFHMAEEIETNLQGEVVYQGRLSESQVYTFLIEYFRRYARFGLQFAVAYQWRDGDTDDAMGRFGIHTAAGVRKRQAAALSDWRDPMADGVKCVVGETLLSGDVHQLLPSGSSGKFNVVRMHDGAVLSLQRDGSQEYRDPGTDGPFEQCEQDGDTLVYAYHFDGLDYIHTVPTKTFTGRFAS